jgi:(1->4)-alpha-D-glucan 1-alpha-D-glucosylmutase
MSKATKEAKIHTSWVNPNTAYDNAVNAFVYSVLSPERNDDFWTDFLSFEKRIAFFGRFNSTAELLLKLTSPGVPDIYQGSEIWDLRLVDPDNRHPVNYAIRTSILRELKKRIQSSREGEKLSGLKNLAAELVETSDDGRIKLYIMVRTLQFRRRYPEIFREGYYQPVESKGIKANHVCAYKRIVGLRSIVVAIPRLVVGLGNGTTKPPLGEDIWQNTRLILPNKRPGDQYRNVFTGEIITVEKGDNLNGLALGEVFGCFPVALLEAQE